MGQLTDVIVIGGGIAGISAAARLAGSAQVVILEKEHAPGTHATGRSAATYIRNYGNATLRALNAASHADLESPPHSLAESSLLSPRGLLYVAKANETALLDRELAGADGMREITVAEAKEHFPVLNTGPVARAAIEPDASDIDVDRLLQGFLRQVRAAGGQVITSQEVQAISRENGVWQVETAKRRFCAPVILNAAGAWADQIAALAGARSKGLVPKRRSAALLPAPEGHDISTWPLVASIAEEWYAKPDAGKLLVSPADQDPVEPMDAWPDEMVLAEGLHRFEQATQMTVERVAHRWAGLRTFASDKTPIAGFDPDIPDFFWLAGQGGYGIQTSPALSQIAADLVLRGTTEVVAPDIIANLSPARPGLG
ncbi:MAG: FAD-binding oxidoreductase [Pseudomonadota bacterium]